MIALLLVLFQEGREFDRLIDELEHELIEVRDRAQESLIRMGPRIEPRLRERMKTSTEEVRSRIEVVLKEIARRERLRDVYADPAPVSVAAEGEPLSRVLEALRRQTRTELVPGDAADERVTVRLEKTALFRAVDEICRAHGGLTFAVASAAGKTTVTFRRGRHTRVRPVVEERFAVWIDSIVLSEKSDLKGGTAAQAAIAFESAWESGNVPLRTRLRLTEVRDDRGRPLAAGESRESGNAGTRHTVPLEAMPESDVRKLSLVRGILEVGFPTDLEVLRFEDATRISQILTGTGIHATLSECVVQDGTARVMVRVRVVPGFAQPTLRLKDKSGAELALQRSSISRSRDQQVYTLTYALPKGTEVGALEVAAMIGSQYRSTAFEFRDVAIRP